MLITEPTYAVRVVTSSPATKPKILAGMSVNENRFPQGFIDSGFPDIPEDLQAPPAVWFALLTSPSSSAAMEHWYSTQNTEEWSMTRMRRGSTVQDETNEDGQPPMDEISVHSTKSNEEKAGEQDDVPETNKSEPLPFSLKRRTGKTKSSAPMDNQSQASVSGSQSQESEDVSLQAQMKLLQEMVANLREDMRAGLCRSVAMTKSQFEKVYSDVDAGFDAVYEHLDDIDEEGHTSGSTRNARSIWDRLNDQGKRELASIILDEMDLSQLAQEVGRELAIPALNRTVADVEARLLTVEEDFSSPHGVIHQIQNKLKEAEVWRDTASSVRGGYIFRD